MKKDKKTQDLLKDLKENKKQLQVARFRFSDKESGNTKKRIGLRKKNARIVSELKNLQKAPDSSKK